MEISHKGQDVYTHLKNQHLKVLSSFFQAAGIYAPSDRLSSYPLVPTTAYYVPPSWSAFKHLYDMLVPSYSFELVNSS